MARPSRNTDQALITAARKLLPKTGCTGLNLRQVAALARVNLGMFHYHFKSKENFQRKVLQAVYEDFFRQLNQELEKGTTEPSSQLAAALGALGRFSRENRALLLSLLRDALNGDPVVLDFLKQNIQRHTSLITDLICQAQAREALIDIEPPVLFVFLMITVNLPNFMTELLERSDAKKPFGRPLKEVRTLFATDEAIQQRLELALSAITKRKERQ